MNDVRPACAARPVVLPAGAPDDRPRRRGGRLEAIIRAAVVATACMILIAVCLAVSLVAWAAVALI